MKNFIYEKNNSGYTVKGIKSRLKNIIIPEGVTKIEGHAFCESLIESVVFPKSLTYIGEGAFEYCENLKSVTFCENGNLEEIDEFAFSGCYALEEALLPKSIKRIRLGAFYNCCSLTKVCIFDTVQILKAETFWGCDNLKSVTVYGNKIPSTWQPEWIEKCVKVIFSNSGSSKNSARITPNETVSKTESNPVTKTVKQESSKKATQTVKQTPTKTITKTVKQEPIKPVTKTATYSETTTQTAKKTSDNGGYKSLKSEPITPLNGYKCNDINDFVIKEGYDGKFIAQIKDKNVKTIVVPKEIEYIGAYENGYAFYGCTSLETFIGHENLKSLWDGTFANCTSLKKVEISEKVSVWRHVFEGCSSLETAYLHSNVFDYAYANSGVKKVVFSNNGFVMSKAVLENTLIESIVIPGNVYYIGEAAFRNCKLLKKAVLENGPTDLMPQVFYGCVNLEEVVIPKSVRNIYDSVFERCRSLKKVTLTEGLYRISREAFSGCESLESINVPNSVEAIGARAFENCKSLKSITFGNKGPNLISDLAFFGCENLKEIVIPANVSCIGQNAFDSRYIKKITIIRDKNSHPSKINLEGFYKDWISKENRSNVKVDVIYK